MTTILPLVVPLSFHWPSSSRQSSDQRPATGQPFEPTPPTQYDVASWGPEHYGHPGDDPALAFEDEVFDAEGEWEDAPDGADPFCLMDGDVACNAGRRKWMRDMVAWHDHPSTAPDVYHPAEVIEPGDAAATTTVDQTGEDGRQEGTSQPGPTAFSVAESWREDAEQSEDLNDATQLPAVELGDSDQDEPQIERPQGRGKMVVALGCADGSVWILSEHRPSGSHYRSPLPPTSPEVADQFARRFHRSLSMSSRTSAARSSPMPSVVSARTAGGHPHLDLAPRLPSAPHVSAPLISPLTGTSHANVSASDFEEITGKADESNASEDGGRDSNHDHTAQGELQVIRDAACSDTHSPHPSALSGMFERLGLGHPSSGEKGKDHSNGHRHRSSVSSLSQIAAASGGAGARVGNVGAGAGKVGKEYKNGRQSPTTRTEATEGNWPAPSTAVSSTSGTPPSSRGGERPFGSGHAQSYEPVVKDHEGEDGRKSSVGGEQAGRSSETTLRFPYQPPGRPLSQQFRVDTDVTTEDGSLEPLVQLLTPDQSPVVKVERLGRIRGNSSVQEKAKMVVLQSRGTLSIWSLEDFSLIRSISLSTGLPPKPARAAGGLDNSPNGPARPNAESPFASKDKEQTKHHHLDFSHLPLPGLLAGASRSRRPSDASVRGEGGNVKPSETADRAALSTGLGASITRAARFENLEIITSGQRHALCYDALSSRLSFISLTPPERIVEELDWPSRHTPPTQVVAAASGVCHLASVDRRDGSVLLRRVTFAPPASTSAHSAVGVVAGGPVNQPTASGVGSSDKGQQQGQQGGGVPMTVHIPPITLGEPIQVDGFVQLARGKPRHLASAGGELLVAWNSRSAAVFTVRNREVVTLASIDEPGITDVQSLAWEGEILITTKNGALKVRLQPADENGDETEDGDRLYVDIVSRLPSPCTERAVCLPASAGEQFVLARLRDGRLQLVCTPTCIKEANHAEASLTLFQTKGASTATGRVHVTAALPLALSRILLGSSTGNISSHTFDKLLGSEPPSLAPLANASRYDGSIIVLREVVNQRTGSKHVVGGTDTGALVVWSSQDLRLQAEFALFTTPVRSIFQLGQEPMPRLQGSLVVVAEDGTVAVLLLDGLRLSFTLPSSSAPLSRLYARDEDLLLLYADGKARLWDARSQELRRSVTMATAEAVLAEGDSPWAELDLELTIKNTDIAGHLLRRPPVIRPSCAAITDIDFRKALDIITRILQPSSSVHSNNEQPGADVFDTLGRIKVPKSFVRSSLTPHATKALVIARSLLAPILPRHLDERLDQLCADVLGEHVGFGKHVGVGIPSTDGAVARTAPSQGRNVWTISPLSTAHRLLVMVSLLRVFLNMEEYERAASEIIAFMASSLPDVVGEEFAQPSLSFFVSYFFDASTEIQASARLLFGSFLSRLSNEEVIQLAEEWQPRLPGAAPVQVQAETSDGPLAVLLLGLIASERYKLLESSSLKDISASIATYIDDGDNAVHQAIAIELCCRGFSIWQHYFDAMEVVRTLFSLATNKESTAAPENRSLARQATLQMASVNTPLFMTTLSLDILQARTPAHCTATMKLVAFMVRRKPLVLYPNLPRLAEAVVKSLDPTITNLREAVVEAATVMINELVSTYPSIAFHGKLQRLAVGTHEGAAIMYDLKTATRLYVLEGHKRQVTACSFSPDGRRLVTVSLEEGKALIWKVGTSITSLFMPGAPPRQGGGGDGSGAYKSIDFHVGDEGWMTVAATLELVRFEWPTDRTARVIIGQTTLSFST